MGCFTALS
jgi:hypothetical protein